MSKGRGHPPFPIYIRVPHNLLMLFYYKAASSQRNIQKTYFVQHFSGWSIHLLFQQRLVIGFE